MTIAEEGHTSVSIIAGPLRPSITSPDGFVAMGTVLYIQISPDIARQWIGVLSNIASKDNV